LSSRALIPTTQESGKSRPLRFQVESQAQEKIGIDTLEIRTLCLLFIDKLSFHFCERLFIIIRYNVSAATAFKL
jgi:hypothetical protein